MDSHRHDFLHIFVWFSLVFTVSPPPSERHDSDELIQYDSSFFSSIWCLPLHYFIFSRYRMWLMVILCMVASFLLCCTWVPHSKDIKGRKNTGLWLPIYLFFCSLYLGCWQSVWEGEKQKERGQIMNNSWYFHTVGGDSRVCPHTHAQSFTYVASINLLLSLFLVLV